MTPKKVTDTQIVKPFLVSRKCHYFEDLQLLLILLIRNYFLKVNVSLREFELSVRFLILIEKFKGKNLLN